MPHIHTKPGQHDLTASAFIIRVEENQPPKVLLHRHKLLHKLLQPGGHVELNENPWQAIIHELREETGYDVHQLKVLQSAPNVPQNLDVSALFLPLPVIITSHQFADLNHFHDDLAFAFLTTELPKAREDENESHEFHWLSLAEISALNGNDDEIIPNVREIAQYVLENFNDWHAEDVRDFEEVK